MLPCNRADRGCVASTGQHYLTGNGADFAMAFKLEAICGTMKEAMQMTAAKAAGAASHAPDGSSIVVRVGRKSVSSRFYLLLK